MTSVLLRTHLLSRYKRDTVPIFQFYSRKMSEKADTILNSSDSWFNKYVAVEDAPEGIFKGVSDRFNGITVDSNLETCQPDKFAFVLQISIMPSTITTLHTYDTIYSADSVEWCPHNPYQQLFVCGTYQLDDKAESITSNTGQTVRKGRIFLFDFDLEQNLLTKKQQIETSAILDQKWHPCKSHLTTVNASGEIVDYRLSSEGELLESDKLKIPNDSEGEQLALSIDWSTSGEVAAVSDSKGGISLISTEPHGMLCQKRWNAHSFEAWICAFDKTDRNVLYTGGDDILLCVYDIRCLDAPSVKLKNKSHGAGVTSLLSVQHKEHLLVTGSYDDCIRIFDTRSMKHCINEKNLGGGVWRLKQNPCDPDQILCACMYHNFSVVSLNNDQSISLDADYFEHGSICYGCDWKYGLNKGEAKYFASCSFYDHKMCLAVLKSEK